MMVWWQPGNQAECLDYLVAAVVNVVPDLLGTGFQRYQACHGSLSPQSRGQPTRMG